ncbi:MAG: NADH-ubiquinone oxidoreductase chain, partial [Myxococcaceae bacterium]|nr:NADH-ubiquinone oxidoreductase chain [Myxococcaceae bacterium]
AGTGVILAAVYMLHAVLKMFWGPLDNPENEGLADVGRRELTTLLPLIALVFLLGFAPSLFLDKLNPTVAVFLQDYDRKLHDSNYNDKQHLLKAETTRSSAQQVALRVGGEP